MSKLVKAVANLLLGEKPDSSQSWEEMGSWE